ncbi:MAG: UbiA family prenyltransferase [Thermocladium sp.]
MRGQAFNRLINWLLPVNPYIELARPEHGIIAGIASVSAYIFSGGHNPIVSLSLFISAFAAEAFLFITNDLLNIAEDSINRPNAPLVSGKARRRIAAASSLAFLIASIIPMLILIMLRLISGLPLIVLSIALLLGFYYNWRGKRILVINNLIIAIVTPLTYIYGLTCANPSPNDTNIMLLLFMTSMVATMGREIIKGAIDAVGDSRVGIKTVATELGMRAANEAGLLMTVAAVVISIPLMLASLDASAYIFIVSIIITDIIMIYCMILLIKGNLEGYRRNTLLGMSITLLGLLINALIK